MITEATASFSVNNWEKYTDQDAFKNYMEHIRKRYEQTSFYLDSAFNSNFSSPFGRLEGLPHAFGTWMLGVALLAGHLKEKKNINNLMVAKTMESFSKALNTIFISNNNVRVAYIVSPSFSWCPLPVNFPQHKVAVLIEKFSSVVKMAILDSLPIGGQREISPKHLEVCPENLWEGYGIKGKYNVPELICRAFFKAIEGLNFKSEIFHSQAIRQNKGGCAIFALCDAITYLQDRHFFHVIKTEQEIALPINGATLRKIIVLLSIYMLGTQSQALLETYKNDEPQFYFKSFSNDSGKNLQESLKKYSLKVKVGDKYIDQNFYTTRKEITTCG